jgi:hypothetical protein
LRVPVRVRAETFVETSTDESNRLKPRVALAQRLQYELDPGLASASRAHVSKEKVVFIKLRDARQLAVAVLLTGLLGGCLNLGDNPMPDDGFLLNDWLRRTQGLVSVLPPREDVRVGDVHVYLTNPEGPEHLTLYAMPLWDNLPATNELEAKYRQRGDFPPTPAEYIQTEIAPDDRAWAEASSDRDLFAPVDRIDRLPGIQLNSFSLTPSQVGQLVPAGAFNVALDESWDDW